MSFIGSKFKSLQNKIASHRPSNPVKSCSASFALLPTFIVFPSCQCQSAPFVPNTSLIGLPFTFNWNLPGAPGAFHGATQSLVRTQTRYVPSEGNVTVVVASSTGMPNPWANK